MRPTRTISRASRSTPPGALCRAGLRRRRRWEGDRLGRTQISRRSGVQLDQRPAPLRPGQVGALPGPRSSLRTATPKSSPWNGVRPAPVAEGLAELQVDWPGVPIVFCDTRKLAEERTYRYRAAAHSWADNELAALDRIGAGEHGAAQAPEQPAPSTAEIRAWARSHGLTVSDRGRLRPEIHQAWQEAHQQ